MHVNTVSLLQRIGCHLLFVAYWGIFLTGWMWLIVTIGFLATGQGMIQAADAYLRLLCVAISLGLIFWMAYLVDEGESAVREDLPKLQRAVMIVTPLVLFYLAWRFFKPIRSSPLVAS